MTDDKGGITENTYSRLPDQGGSPWIENVYEITAGQFKGTNSVTSCLIGPSMVLEKALIDHLRYAKRCASQVRGHEATEYPAETIKAIASGVNDYAAMVVFKGTETAEGKPCDRYSYSYKANYMNIPAVTSGDLWLNDSVPFGLVKDSATIKDASGKLLHRWDMVLVQSGSGAKSALTGWSWGATGDAPAETGGGSSVEIAPASSAGPFELSQRGAHGVPLFQGNVEVRAGRD
jgi:hypothetical protein